MADRTSTALGPAQADRRARPETGGRADRPRQAAGPTSRQPAQTDSRNGSGDSGESRPSGDRGGPPVWTQGRSARLDTGEVRPSGDRGDPPVWRQGRFARLDKGGENRLSLADRGLLLLLIGTGQGLKAGQG